MRVRLVATLCCACAAASAIDDQGRKASGSAAPPSSGRDDALAGREEVLGRQRGEFAPRARVAEPEPAVLALAARVHRAAGAHDDGVVRAARDRARARAVELAAAQRLVLSREEVALERVRRVAERFQGSEHARGV